MWWWWWWWEMLALIVCVASVVGLAVLLNSIDNTPLRRWYSRVRPNSVVAIFTTVNKASMLVPAASCISQLKWHHFSRAPRKVTELQLFDEASRGPWGSLVFLFRVSHPTKTLITAGFALLTILALGIDASAQQLLAYTTQETEFNNGSATMGTTAAYFSKSTTSQLADQSSHPCLLVQGTCKVSC
jgi:hypothetical protein